MLVVLGPTATGKTALAIRLAQTFRGEVVSADSRYFYRGMDVGTAKPDSAERRGVPHHLIDIRDPHEPYSLGSFLDDAYRAIEDVAARGSLPVVAGGTPQYLRALIEGWTPPEVEPDEALRARLADEPVDALFAILQHVDPASAERIGPHNKRRMIRALEVFEQLGRPMSEVAVQHPPPYRLFIAGLTQPRDILYARIDQRVQDMYAAGWLDEVSALQERGVTRDMSSMSAHGYREALDVINGDATITEAIERTQHMIHRYVRHQQTWFRRFNGIHWYDSAAAGYETQIVEDIGCFLASADCLNDAPRNA